MRLYVTAALPAGATVRPLLPSGYPHSPGGFVLGDTIAVYLPFDPQQAAQIAQLLAVALAELRDEYETILREEEAAAADPAG